MLWFTVHVICVDVWCMYVVCFDSFISLTSTRCFPLHLVFLSSKFWMIVICWNWLMCCKRYLLCMHRWIWNHIPFNVLLVNSNTRWSSAQHVGYVIKGLELKGYVCHQWQQLMFLKLLKKGIEITSIESTEHGLFHSDNIMWLMNDTFSAM